MNFSSLFEIIIKSTYRRLIRLCVFTILLSSCVVTKQLKEGEAVLNKYTIKGVSPGHKANIDPLIAQKPNARLLLSKGPAHLVTIYNIGQKNFLFHYDTARIKSNKAKLIKEYDEKIAEARFEHRQKKLVAKKIKKVNKKDRALNEGNQLMRWGEPLAIYDPALTLISKEQTSMYLNTMGYYANKVKVTESFVGADKNKVNLTFDIEFGPEYKIDSIDYVIPDEKVKELFMTNIDKRVIKPKTRIVQSFLNDERNRVYELLVNNGYYAFSKEYVRFEVDSVTLESPNLILRLVIANPIGSNEHKVYTVDSVTFVTDAGTNQITNIPNEHFRGITYTYGRFKYSPKILDWHQQMNPKKIYQRNNVIETQRRLSYLDNFKFININFDSLDGKFIAHVFTSPAEKYQTSTETGFSYTQGAPGPFATISLKNRNLFRGLEITELNSHFKVQGLNGVSKTTNTYSSIQYGTELSITFPQFLSPLGRYYKKKIAQFNPKTRFALAFNHEDRLKEYQRTTFNTNMAYVWKAQDHVSFTYTPMELSYIKSKTDSTFQAFLDDLAVSGNSYVNTFKSSFVSSGSFKLIVNNNYGVTKDASFLQLFVETGGHLFTLLGSDPFGNSLEYYKYSKFSLDLRKSFYVHRKQSIATRFNIGLALPYGDNKSLPYEKYFFAGGSNSIRAWKPRRLGPGAYGDFKPNGDVNDQREQPGDLIIEASIELRQKWNNLIDWALFVDAGNVWLLNSATVNSADDPELDDGVFRFNSFTKEIAIGAGAGLRFDLSILIFRVDLGWKLIDPAQPMGRKWVGDDIFPNPIKNSTLNIGIGYPF